MKTGFKKTIRLFLFLIIFWHHHAACRSSETGSGLPPKNLREVTLQLKWKHQFQFAGYYAAIEKGYYRAAGLNVTLLEAVDGQVPADSVLSGQAHFGVAMSDLIMLRAQGHPVVALAAIYQHSPLVLLMPAEGAVQNIHELAGKRIALEAHAEELLAYFESEGVPIWKMILFPHDYSIDNLLSKKVDAISAYSTDEPFLVMQHGIRYQTFSPRSGGIDFYGDTLFTVEEQINNNPEMVLSFVDASLRGWQYAVAHTDEIIDLILEKYSKRHTRAHLEFEAEKSKRLIMADVVELGYMNPGRWAHISDTFKSLHKIPGDFTLAGFLFDRKPAPDYRVLYIGISLALAVCTLASFITFRFYKLNRILTREMKKRKRMQTTLVENERKLSTLMCNLPGIAYRCLHDDDYTMKFVSQGCKELTGYDVNELVNNRQTSFNLIIHPDDRSVVKSQVDDAISQFIPFKIFYRIIDKSGHIKWCWEQGRGVFSPNGDLKFLEGFITDITKQKESELEREKLVTRLKEAMNEIKTLSGLLPLCSHCKKIRDDKGYWNQIETYISDRADVNFSHSICPDCQKEHYPDIDF